MHGNQPIGIEILLAQLPLFSSLGPEDLARIAAGTRQKRVTKDDVLFRKGNVADGFHLIVIGRIKLVFTTAEGLEKVVEILGPGQSFGETYMLEDLPYDVSAVALSDAVVLHISKAAIFQEFDRDPQVRRKMLAGMAERLRQVMSDVESYSLHSGKQRVIHYFLLTLPKDAPAKDAVLVLPTSKSNIASRLNLTQEHFSRILRDLSSQELIVVQGAKILIPDLQRLRLHSISNC
ncbi:MAG TPA: Crp/Fnr family transcriptional regulator [Rhodocyclaceae bacterium]|nr:Crp/Fnr family transcriptional regulator [Rhodocyclaceae bacterium]